MEGEMSGSEEAMGEDVADDGGGRERASRQREFGEALRVHTHKHTPASLSLPSATRAENESATCPHSRLYALYPT